MSGPKQPELSTDAKELAFECPHCHVACRSDSYFETLVGYGSELGHNHNDNCRKFEFTCQNGHGFKVRPRNTCPTCSWKGSAECETCGPWFQDATSVTERYLRAPERRVNRSPESVQQQFLREAKKKKCTWCSMPYEYICDLPGCGQRFCKKHGRSGPTGDFCRDCVKLKS